MPDTNTPAVVNNDGITVAAPANGCTSPSVITHLLPTLITKLELARYLRVSARTVDGLIHHRRITHRRIGGQVRFTVADIERYLEKCSTDKPRKRRMNRIPAVAAS